VLLLLREGLSNPQIASRLAISRSGVKYHVSEIISKLGVSSRQEAAAWQQEPPRRLAGLALLLTRASFAAKTAAAVAIVAALGLVGAFAWSALLNDSAGRAGVPTVEPTAARSEAPLPGDLAAGTPPERWGDFVLAQDQAALIRSVERPAPASSSLDREGRGLLDYPTPYSTSESEARADARVPLLGSFPASEEFLAANVLEEPGQGAVEGWAAYIRPELQPAEPNADATILVFWTRLASAPYYVTPLKESPGLGSAFLVRTEKVSVRGNQGVMRLYAARDGGDIYPTRYPSVLIHWFEGDVLWMFASYFLTPDEALRAAESTRPVSLP